MQFLEAVMLGPFFERDDISLHPESGSNITNPPKLETIATKTSQEVLKIHGGS